MKLCVNCIHHHKSRIEWEHLCTRLSETKIDPVTGATTKVGGISLCQDERGKGISFFSVVSSILKIDRCGPEAKYFQEK